MIRLLILVEGQSEEQFVKQVLAPYLAPEVIAIPVILKTRRDADGTTYRGGVTKWAQIRGDLQRLLGDRHAYVTTLLDYYGLPEDFPGLNVAVAQSLAQEKVTALQNSFAEAMGYPQRFIPFLALHEFEAWLFSAPEIVSKHFDRDDLLPALEAIVKACGEPETINHGRTTHPKARLQTLLDGRYREVGDGAILMTKIGISRIAEACPHFRRWLQQLTELKLASYLLPDKEDHP